MVTAAKKKKKDWPFLICKTCFPLFLVKLFTSYEVIFSKTYVDFFYLKNNKSNRKLESV